MKKILCVDDFRSIRTIVKKILEKQGHEVVEAENGKDAFDKLKKGFFDLLITDYDMPVMNGAELIKNVREYPRTRHLPIIVLTTNRQEKKANEIGGLKIDGWVIKPFQTEDFLPIVNKVL